LTKTGWATFWPIFFFLQTHLVTQSVRFQLCSVVPRGVEHALHVSAEHFDRVVGSHFEPDALNACGITSNGFCLPRGADAMIF
jgi:hypothetical protein